MEWLLLVLVLAVVGGGVLAARGMGARRLAVRDHHEQLEEVRRLADEDLALFAEQLHRLDAAIGPLDDAARSDHRRAHEALESARQQAADLQSPAKVGEVTAALADGGRALASAQARVADREPPPARVPCLFDPRHGPSVGDVVWTPPGRGTRTVPACASDAARLAAGEQPDLRTVRVGLRDVPYWEAGPAYLAYLRGYLDATGTTASGAADLSWVLGHSTDGDASGGRPDAWGSHGARYGDAGGFGQH